MFVGLGLNNKMPCWPVKDRIIRLMLFSSESINDRALNCYAGLSDKMCFTKRLSKCETRPVEELEIKTSRRS